MPRPKRDNPQASSLDPFTLENEPTTGDLSRTPDEVIPPGQSIPATEPVQRRKRRTKAELEAEKVAAFNKEPDEALIETCSMAVDTVADIGVDFIHMSEPGDEWRYSMSKLSARWLDKFEEGEWFKSHPIEAQMLLHLSKWVLPNVCALSYEHFLKWRQTRAERRERTEKLRAQAAASSVVIDTVVEQQQ